MFPLGGESGQRNLMRFSSFLPVVVVVVVVVGGGGGGGGGTGGKSFEKNEEQPIHRRDIQGLYYLHQATNLHPGCVTR